MIKKITSIILSLFIGYAAVAQPGLQQLKEKQLKESNGTNPIFSLNISPKNESLGSMLLSPSANVPMGNARQWISDQLQLRPGVDELRKQELPGTYPEMAMDKFVQYFKGIKVEHGNINAAGRAGKLGLIQMEFYAIPDNLITVPAISEDAALQKAMDYLGAKKYVWEGYAGTDPLYKKPVAALVIVKNNFSEAENICLAYKFLIRGNAPTLSTNVYVNAIDGVVVFTNSNNTTASSNIKNTTIINGEVRPPLSAAVNPTPERNLSLSYADLPAQAATLYSGTQEIHTDKSTRLLPPFADYYRLRQSTNLFNGSQFEVITLKNGFPIGDVEQDNNDWTTAGADKTALEVHYNIQVILDYWKNKHGRISYDNNGAAIKSIVHIVMDPPASAAVWKNDIKTMHFGDGLYHTEAQDNIGPDVGLDITAHELGHAVAGSADMPQFTEGREPGALNEGFSDIWAACVENYGIITTPTSKGNKNIWLIAEESIKGYGTPGIRNLKDPKSKELPDTYYGANFKDASIGGCPVPVESGQPGSNDKCGIHSNASVLSKWFYLITEGGTGTNDHNNTYNVSGLGFGISESIAYNTERLLTMNADYHAAMNTSLNYTSWKYGATSNELNQVMAAWRAVGVLDTLFFYSSNTAAFNLAGANSFNCIVVGKGGHVWAGTGSPGKGLFKYDDIEWKKYDQPGDASTVNRLTYRDMKADKKGGVWVAQSGYASGGSTSNNSGGVYYFDDSTFKSKRFYTASTITYKPNTITRNISSIWVDTTRNNDSAARRGKILPQVWITAQPFLNAGINKSGGVAMGLTDTVYTTPDCCATLPYDSNFLKISSNYLTKVDNRTTYRGAQTVGGNGNEVWVYSDSNYERSRTSWGYEPDFVYNGHPQQILRYNASNGDSIGVYDFATVPLLGEWFTAKAIHFDKNGNRWLGMLNNGPTFNTAIVVMDNQGRWHNSASIIAAPGAPLSLPDIFPISTVVNNNAITSDKEGNVYIGTNKGLVVYDGGASPFLGVSPLEDYNSYRRYTTKDGLPSNTIRGIAVDTMRNGVWLATDNGIVLWRLRGANRQISVAAVKPNLCNRDISYRLDIKGKFYSTPSPNHRITELSSASGSFATPTVLEDVEWLDNNGFVNYTESKNFVLPDAIPNGDNYLIRVRATNPPFISALSQTFAIKKSTQIIPSLGAVNHPADRECTDEEGWTHYYFSNGTDGEETDDIKLLSIFKNGNSIGTVGDGIFQATCASTAGAGSNTGVPVINSFITNPFISMNRFWNVVPNPQPVTPLAVRFYYNEQDLQDINGTILYGPIDHTKLVFYKTNGNPNPTTNLLGITAPPISYTIGTIAGLSTWVHTQISPTIHQAEFAVRSFSGGSGGSTPNNGPLAGVLPLTLLSFSARQTGTGAILQWQTTAEINTERFEIQRSADGSTFTGISSLQASGDSSTLKNYQTTDAIPLTGRNYYRLKMIDRDGHFTYSPIRFITLNKSGIVVNVYPNPAKGILNIEHNFTGRQLTISITDIRGRQIIQWKKTNSPLIQLPVNSLSSGTYLLMLTDGKDMVNQKLVKH